MAPNQMEGTTVLSQFAPSQLDVDIASRPGPHKPKTTSADASAPAVSVTVTELPSPPASPLEGTGTLEAPPPEPMPPAKATTKPCTFPLFPFLPAELRLKIWHMSFLPRTMELHTRRAHYADKDPHGGTPKWQSQSRNPAALSVSVEARAAALECYTVALPLFTLPSRTQTSERPGDLLQHSDRVLYLNLEQDTVVLLGDLAYERLTALLAWFRRMDRPVRGRGGGVGLRRLGISVALWTHEGGALTLSAFSRTVLAEIERFTLFMFPERQPPEGWTGGLCVLEEAAADTDYYRRFVIGRGRQFRVGNGWMVVGKQPMKLAEIIFAEGW
ncbi:hypothetical protein F5144DRAFT_584607 [Chaetomium tenue]|uniref:Uncharacterized protein n=1 Tax=Chaetomium tenue TaxID=1854479 RepID=A0ACB7P024_9PEZI|nr:hypothetical protein F5144DRAFT_584607 [Chaetomium globosum]